MLLVSILYYSYSYRPCTSDHTDHLSDRVRRLSSLVLSLRASCSITRLSSDLKTGLRLVLVWTVNHIIHISAYIRSAPSDRNSSCIIDSWCECRLLERCVRLRSRWRQASVRDQPTAAFFFHSPGVTTVDSTRAQSAACSARRTARRTLAPFNSTLNGRGPGDGHQVDRWPWS